MAEHASPQQSVEDFNAMQAALDQPLTDAEHVVVSLALLQADIKGGKPRDVLYRQVGEIIEQMRPLLPGAE